MRRVAVRMGRPFTEFDVPPLASVALNKLTAPGSCGVAAPTPPPKLKAPPVLDALPVFELLVLALPELKANGVAELAPNANGAGCWAAAGATMPNGLLATGSWLELFMMEPNEVADGGMAELALLVDAPKEKGDPDEATLLLAARPEDAPAPKANGAAGPL